MVKTPHSPSPSPQEMMQGVLNHIYTLSQHLPLSVPLAVQADSIYTVMISPEGESWWQTINKRFDVLFGEDCHNANGRLLHIHHGPLRMDLVCSYLREIDITWMPIDIMSLKVLRLYEELKYLTWVDMPILV